MTQQRFAKAEFAAWIGIFGNLALAVLKGAAGFLSGSQALLADAANSASDTAGSLAVLIGFRAAKRPPDRDHPYGHGKAEPISAIIVSVLVLLVGFEVARGAVVTLFFSEGPIPAPEPTTGSGTGNTRGGLLGSGTASAWASRISAQPMPTTIQWGMAFCGLSRNTSVAPLICEATT